MSGASDLGGNPACKGRSNYTLAPLRGMSENGMADVFKNKADAARAIAGGNRSPPLLTMRRTASRTGVTLTPHLIGEITDLEPGAWRRRSDHQRIRKTIVDFNGKSTSR